MRKVSSKKTALMAATAAAMTGMFASAARAQQTWNVTDAIGSFNWNEDANWTPGPYPNAVGIVANVNNDINTAMTISIPGGSGITVGTLNLGDGGAAPDQKFTLGTAPGGAGTFIFDNGTNDAHLNVLKDISSGSISEFDSMGTNVTLNSNLAIDAGPIVGSVVQIRGKISDGVNGPKGMTISGSGWVELRQAGEANTFSGLTTVNSRLRLMSGGGFDLIAGDVVIQNGGVLQDGFGNGNCIADTSNINVINGRYNNGGGSDTIGSLEGGNLGTVGGGGGTITFGGNGLDKTYNGIFNSEPSLIKTGTGVQTLGGPSPSAVPDDSPANQSFTVLGGRVDLAKTAGVTSIGQRNLNIGDGSQAGALRPEVRLQSNEQIQVHLSAGPTETTPVTLNSGILNLNGFNETVGSIIVVGTGTSTLKKAGGLTMVNGLTVNDTATLEAASDGTHNNVIKTPSLTIGATARVDLQDNKLIVSGGDVAAITAQIKSGFNLGGTLWAGPGITTSLGGNGASSYTALGVIRNDFATVGLPPGPIFTSFGGQAVGVNDVLVKYTYFGDADLNGQINSNDYFQIDTGFLAGRTGWINGDFDYNGVINSSDYFLIDNAFLHQGGVVLAPAEAAAASLVVVPEPSVIVFGAAEFLLLGLGRRRMRRAALASS